MVQSRRVFTHNDTEKILADSSEETSRLGKQCQASQVELSKLKQHMDMLSCTNYCNNCYSSLDERDVAVQKAKQESQKHYYQEMLNQQLTEKSEASKAELKSLADQLGNFFMPYILFLEAAMNKIHEYETHEIASQATQQRVLLVILHR